jgi:DNA modification methylase
MEDKIPNYSPQLEFFEFPPEEADPRVRKMREKWLSKRAASDKSKADYGTFKDSLRVPIHRWFKYPAGYSYRLVEEKIKQYKLNHQHWILDPFVGCGTTSVEAKKFGINSIGIEAHPFVHWVARTKTNWDLDLNQLAAHYQRVVASARTMIQKTDPSELPDLVHKCYSPQNLISLVAIRNAIKENVNEMDAIRDFLNLALTDTLRNSSKAATGWPYIAPNKIHEKAVEKEAFAEFDAQFRRMFNDVKFMQQHYSRQETQCILLLGDAREAHSQIQNESIDLALTSPPYLNNYDYADRTRLETYFFGWYKSWGEISKQVRDQLITSATTQIQRGKFRENNGLSTMIKELDAALYNELVEKVSALSGRRKHKGGKKSYDCLVAGYFSDMARVLQQVFRALKPGLDFVLVLGDSAPYGIYIPTHEYLARIGLALGFSSWQVEELRTRGDKWRENPQRHKVKLKEVILTLTK